MARFSPETTLVLSGIDFDAKGANLLLSDVVKHTQMRYYVAGNTFSLRRRLRRYCIGTFDLQTHMTHACEEGVELPDDLNDLTCFPCREKTGFNPSFYHAETISYQQRLYNATPHYVYLAYFAPGFVKAGISAESRGIARLLEQGARAAAIVGRYGNADDARELEAYLCAQEGIYETMRASKKADLLVNTRYDFEQAKAILSEEAKRCQVDIVDGPFDFTPFYFPGFVPTNEDLQMPEDAPDDICGGHCIGMVGSSLVFRGEQACFVVPIKEWESYSVELYLDEVMVSYSYEPTQMGLF